MRWSVPIDRIRGVLHGSTTYVREGFGSYSSRSTVMGGSAIVAAAATLQGRDPCARRRNASAATASEIAIDGDMRARPRRTAGRRWVSWPPTAFRPRAPTRSNKRTYSYGAHAAHVAVDPKTGHVEVIDYVAVEDVGRIVNPLTLHGQALGAIVQGLGGALLEHLVYDEDGQLLTGSLADYLMPTASDFPGIRTVALEQKPTPHNPLGAKGAGEGGIIPVGGVIANAVAAALGVEPRDLPLSPPRVWQLVLRARGGAR